MKENEILKEKLASIQETIDALKDADYMTVESGLAEIEDTLKSLPNKKEDWKDMIHFGDSGEGAWAGLVDLLEQKKIGTDGKSPIYIYFSDWEGDVRDYIEVSNAPINHQPTCRERYDEYLNENVIGNPKEEAKEEEQIWDDCCVACPLHKPSPAGSCENIDETA